MFTICSSVRSEGNNRWCRRMSAKACARRLFQEKGRRGGQLLSDNSPSATCTFEIFNVFDPVYLISCQTKNNYWLIFSVSIKESIMSVLVIFSLCRMINYYGLLVSKMMSEIIALLGLNPRIKNQWFSISTFMSKDENIVVCYISAFVKGWKI